MINIPIFLSSDNNYAPFVATTIASICDNTKSFCDFYILDGGITQENQEKICELKKQFNNFSIEFIRIDVEKEFKDIDYKNDCGYVSISTYSRLLIPDLKPMLNKCIYIDVDIIVLNDILDLWMQDIEDNAIAWVLDQGINDLVDEFMEKYNLAHYYNAGVLLINTKKWRSENYLKIIQNLEPKIKADVHFADQDLLNLVFKNDCKMLEGKFNCQYGLTKNIIVRHFVNVYKPWRCNYFKVGTTIKTLENFDDFWKYAELTLFYDELKFGYEKSINSNILTKRMSVIANKMKEADKETV